MKAQDLLKQLKVGEFMNSKKGERNERRAFFLGHLLSNPVLAEGDRSLLLQIATWFTDEIEKLEAEEAKMAVQPATMPVNEAQYDRLDISPPTEAS